MFPTPPALSADDQARPPTVEAQGVILEHEEVVEELQPVRPADPR
jgi:hypothetical protein